VVLSGSSSAKRTVRATHALSRSCRINTRVPHSDENAANRDVGTGRQIMVLERWTNPKPRRRTCSPRYGVPPCRGESAGVAKRPR
jgi:hypothetical protein